MTKFSTALKKAFVLLLCLGLTFSLSFTLCRPAKAAAAITMSATTVSSEGAFTVNITVPAASWNTFLFEITYDHTVIQGADATATGGIMLVPNAQQGNTTGVYKVSGLSVMPATADVTVSIPFTVINNSAASVQISLAVTDFAAGSAQIEHTVSSPVTVTLPSAPPPPSTDTSTDTDTETSTDGNTDTGTTDTSTDTNTSTSTSTSTDTNTNTSTDTSTNTNTNTDTSTKTDTSTRPSSSTSSKTDSNTETSDTATDSDVTSDTGSDPLLSDSNTDSDEQTNATDPSVDQTSSDSGSSGAPIGSSGNGNNNNGKPNGGTVQEPISSTLIAGISIVIAVVFCGAMTAIALLRHKKD